MPLLSRLIAAVVAATFLAAAPADAADVYRSPGYKGIRRAPQTLPPTPPTPIPLGSGEKPQVLVDAAGTAHVVWNEARGEAADVTRYCRIKRGATACDSNKELVPTGPDDGRGDPRYNSEVGSPRVFALGDQVAIVTHRYPQPFIGPDGRTAERSTWLFVSNDGGDNFQDGVIVGTNESSGQGAVFGPDGSPRIGLISDTQTGGPFFQEITGARFEQRQADLGDDGVSVSVAPVGGTIIAAWVDLTSTVHVRQWSGQGDIFDQATWSEATFPGDEPRLASGPGGVFLMSRAPSGGDRRYTVRSVGPGGTSFGAPIAVPGTESTSRRDLFQDPSGKLYATYVKADDQGLDGLHATTSIDGGKTWSTARVLRTTPAGSGVWTADSAATTDGGGFTVMQESGNGAEGPISAIAFGAQTATGVPGLGNESGGAAPPDVVEGCARFEFQQVDIVLPEGCLLGVKGQKNVRVAEGTLKLNGLEIVPEGSAKILLNARERTLDTTGTVKVQLRAPGISPIVLFRGELHINLKGERENAGIANGDGCSGQLLANFDAGAELKGFPIAGSIGVYLQPDATCIPVTLELPKAFGGIRGAAVLRANNRQGLVVDSLKIEVAQAFIGPLLIKDVLVEYSAGTDEWSGAATLGLPPAPGGIELGASVKFQGGKFKQGGLSFTLPYPGIGLDPFGVSYLRQIRGGFGIDPLFISAGVSVGLIPIPPIYLFGVDGDIKITIADPVEIEVTGTGRVVTFPLARVGFKLNTDGFARAFGNLTVSIGVTITVRADVFVDLPSGTFAASGLGGVCFAEDAEGRPDDCIVKGEAVMSNKGIATCLTTFGIDNGTHMDWGDILPTPDFFSCDLDDYRIKPPGGKIQTAQAGGRAVAVPANTKVMNLRLTGDAERAPDVALVSPTGERIEPLRRVSEQNESTRAVTASYGNVTFVGIKAPAAGTWQVVPNDGSAPITELATTTDLPEPEVAGSVGGKGRDRIVSYRASTGDGLKTTIVETGPMGSRVLGVAKRGRGTIKFSPAPGPRGKRTIEAIVERNGNPRMRKAIASYTAPPALKPGRVKGFKLSRRGRTLTARWKRLRGAYGYAVRFDLPDGRHELVLLRGRSTSAVFRGAPNKGRVSATVVARDTGGRRGPAAKASLLR